MAANVTNYKGLQIVDNAQNEAGQKLTNNFKALVDNLPKTNMTTTGPSVNADTSMGYEALSKWLDTATDKVYHCVDPKVGAAQWVQQKVLSDSSPTLSADLNCGDYIIKGNISSDTTLALFTVAGDVNLSKSVDFQGRSLQKIDSILFAGGHTITANEIRIESIWLSEPEKHKIKLGPIRWPNRPGFNWAALATLANSGNTQWGCVPVGTIIPWPGYNVPRWSLLCDGAAVSRTVYARLFSIIGTNFGAGDGSTTFNLPNLSGKVPVGRQDGVNQFNGFGQSVSTYAGEKTHALTTAEIPNHSHVVGTHNSTTGCYPNTYGNTTNTNTWSTCTGAAGACASLGHNNLPPYNTVMYVIMVGA